MHTALTIAGSDPTAGAGIQADLRTFASFDVSGTCAITAITVQNATGVRQVFALAPELVVAQIDAVVDQHRVAATKIGMLGNAAIVDAVAGAIRRHGLANVVLDPVLAASAGGALLEADAIPHLTSQLFPLAAVVTPNVSELQALTGAAVHDLRSLREAAARLVALGARAVVAKGGHLAGPPIDLVYDGARFTELPGDRLEVAGTHGTGCRFSSALAARLAHGDTLVDAARAAKRFVRDALA
jgi:hydroxymethylpyrimidine/phosphomethylpyrimidine kinase